MHVKRLSQLALLSLCFTLAPIASANAPSSQQSAVTQIVQSKAPSWSAIVRDVENRKILEDAQKLADEVSLRLMSLKQLSPEEMTFENTFGFLDRYDNDFITFYRFVNQITHIKDSPAVREVVQKLIAIRVEFVRKLFADKEVWLAVQTAAKQPWVKDLSPEQRRLVDASLWGFRSAGADLSPEKQKRFFALIQELITLNNQFSKNVADASASWKVLITDEAELEGVNSMLKSRAAYAAKQAYPNAEKEQWLISAATGGEQLLYSCHSSEMRRKVWEAIQKSLTQAPHDNRDLVKRILALRHEQAQLLGHKHFADQVTERYMMGSAEEALNFVNELRDHVISLILIDNMLLRESVAKAAGEMQGDALPALAPWDAQYQQLRRSYNKDDRSLHMLSAYLPVEHSVDSMMSYLGELFSMRFDRLESAFYDSAPEATDSQLAEVPHPDILAYEVFDTKKNKRLGILYLDLMSRANKRPGAWTSGIREATHADGALVVLTANLSSMKKDLKGLFTYRDLRILFHEMGHALHMLLDDNALTKQNAIYSAWDFVETPSQAIERLAIAPDFLRRYGKHFLSGDPVPDDLLESVDSLKSGNSLRELLHILTWSKIDLELHSDAERFLAGRSIEEYVNDIVRSEGLVDGEGPLSYDLYRLSHCMAGGYAAGFYSYAWSDILAADIYSRFSEEGADMKQVGDELREKILSKGDSAPAAELYRNFMGRDPEYDAFLDEME